MWAHGIEGREMADREEDERKVHEFTIDTELTRSQLMPFPRFIREKLAFGQLPGVRMSRLEAMVSREGHYMQFAAGPERGAYEALVRVYLDRPIRVELRSRSGRDEGFERQLRDVLFFSLQFFEEEARKSTLYLSFVPGSPKTAELRRRPSVISWFFSGNLLNIFLLSVLIGVVLFTVMDEYAPVALIAIMVALVLSAGRLSSLGSPWRITGERREVLLVQYNVPEGQMAGLKGERVGQVREAKLRAYDLFSECPGLVCQDKVSQVFSEAGLEVDPKDLLVRRLDVYGMVERLAARFGMDVPTVVISQDARPNAAATGFTKNLATVIITMGLLVQLDEEEIELVIGHELSHLRSGDPVVLFSLVAAEYLLRVFVYWPYIGALWLPYIVGVFWSIFFFGKFLESRADLEAGLVLGKPRVMADSLKKIGFRRLILEERFLEPGAGRLGEWLRFDPHPPLYFRIQRLESLDVTDPPRHPFLSSVRAVLSGLANSRKAP